MNRFIRGIGMKIPALRRLVLQRDYLLEQVDISQKESSRRSDIICNLKSEMVELEEKIAFLLKCSSDDRATISDLTSKKIPEFSKVVWSHWGEDSIVDYYLKEIKNGRYLDIGCYHPALYSNTMMLYSRGWSGVNIDPNGFMIEQCRLMRPRDVGLNLAVGAGAGEMDYYRFHDWASSNTLSSDFAQLIANGQHLEMPVGEKVRVCTLSEIMNEHFSAKAPEFMNVDVEGLDVEVLQSNDWNLFTPFVIAIEDIDYCIETPRESRIYNFLTDLGYRMDSRCVYTNIFIDGLKISTK